RAPSLPRPVSRTPDPDPRERYRNGEWATARRRLEARGRARATRGAGSGRRRGGHPGRRLSPLVAHRQLRVGKLYATLRTVPCRRAHGSAPRPSRHAGGCGLPPHHTSPGGDGRVAGAVPPTPSLTLLTAAATPAPGAPGPMPAPAPAP